MRGFYWMRFLPALLVLCASAPALAVTSTHSGKLPSSMATSFGEVQLLLRETTPINFGSFTMASNGSLVVDARSGSCQARGGAVSIKQTCTRGIVEVHGAPGEQVTLLLPSEITLHGAPNSNVQMSDFTMDHDNPITIGADGRTVVGVGATLRGFGAVTSGQFTGQFPMLATVLK